MQLPRINKDVLQPRHMIDNGQELMHHIETLYIVLY